MMPNPDAAMRLINNGCKVQFGKDVLTVFKKVKGPDDLTNAKDGQRVPKSVKKVVWLVNIRIPITLLDVSEDIIDTDDIDYDSVENAYDEELDGEQGLQDEDNTTNPQEQPNDNQTEEVPT